MFSTPQEEYNLHINLIVYLYLPNKIVVKIQKHPGINLLNKIRIVWLKKYILQNYRQNTTLCIMFNDDYNRRLILPYHYINILTLVSVPEWYSKSH